MNKLSNILFVLGILGLIAGCGTESKPVYQLTVFVNGEGSISPSGGEYEQGETITLTATPSAGWKFQEWGGATDGTSNTLTFTIQKDVSVTAIFQRKEYPLIIDIEGQGTVEERIVTSNKSTDYPYGTVVELTSNPSDGWVFYEWNGALIGDENPKEIDIDEEKTVTSVFKSIDELLTIDIIGEGDVDIIQESFEENPSRRGVTLSPVIQSGWRFVQWGGDVSSTDEEIEVIIDGEKSITLTLENEGIDFYEDYAAQDGVVMTDSGLLYRVIQNAEGILPTAESVAVFDFIGSLVDGEQFNNTFENDQPAIAPLNTLPSGLQEGLMLAPIGSRYEFVLPPDLGYSDNPPYGIPPGAFLIFEIDLLHSNNYDPIFLNKNAQREDVTVTESGFQYRILEEGSGATPNISSNVSVEYTGTLIYGETFDTSRDTDGPATFNLSGVIDGFAEGVQLMQEGARYEFFLPADLAYGSQPPQNSSLYPGAALIFDVELVSVND